MAACRGDACALYNGTVSDLRMRASSGMTYQCGEWRPVLAHASFHAFITQRLRN